MIRLINSGKYIILSFEVAPPNAYKEGKSMFRTDFKKQNDK